MSGRPGWREALDRTGLLERLAEHDPRIVGTLPLEIDVPGSDIDIVCHAEDPGAIAPLIWPVIEQCAEAACYQWQGADRALVCRFFAYGWPFEIFASTVPTGDQPGWRHFDIERRLLALGGDAFRAAIRAARARGLKTEPAFAEALGLAGDPYAALLALGAEDDGKLSIRIA